MIWEQKSKGILMLNGLVERGYVKCHQYWPEREGEELKFDVELKVKLESEEHREHYIIRKCLLTDEQSGQSRQVIQFHYTSWPDFGLPQSRSSFLEYLIAVRDSGSLDISQDVGPPVVHCSAGIGRSGTFCLVDSCLLLVSFISREMRFLENVMMLFIDDFVSNPSSSLFFLQITYRSRNIKAVPK